jgi:hypothetical protein
VRTAWRLGAFLLVTSVGCADPITPVAIIVLTNTWQELGNPQHTFQFLDDTDGVAASTGTFTGTERLNDGATEYAIEGYWRNSRVTMTIARNPAVTYTARIVEDNPDRLDFSGSSGQITVVRNVGN